MPGAPARGRQARALTDERPVAGKRLRPSLAALLSFLWPGLGQFYAGRRRAAIVFTVPVAVVLVLALREVVAGPVVFALSMVNPTFAIAVTCAIVVVGAIRFGSVLHAFIAAPSRRRSRAGERAALSLLLVAVVLPHSVMAYFSYSAYLAGVEMNKPIDNNTAWHSEATLNPSDQPVLTTPKPGDTSEPRAVASPNAVRRYETILLVGADFSPGRDHALTDTMMAVSIDKQTKKVVMVSVPRDTTMFPLYWNNATLGPTFKLNALTTAVGNKWFPAPDQPMATLEKEIGYILGIPIDYYALLDIAGFQRMIDKVGGVDVSNPTAVYDPLYQVQWPLGRIHLDGYHAMLYVRSRYGDNDYARAARQQAVLVALKQKLVTPAMIVRLPDFLTLIGSTIRTDFPQGRIQEMATLAQGLADDAVTKCVLGPPYSYHPDSSETGGTWTSRLDMKLVASLSVSLYGDDSGYRGQVDPQPCKTA